MGYDFMYCDTCRAKPGSPILCEGCQHNSHVFDRLNRISRQVYDAADLARYEKDSCAFAEEILRIVETNLALDPDCSTAVLVCRDPQCRVHGR